MDFSKFDERGAAENGVWVDLVDPNTFETIVDDEGNVPQVLVRGTAARSVQAELKKLATAANDGTERTMEGAHQKLVQSASVLIAGFQHVNIGGKAVDPKNPKPFLDLTFPAMEQTEDGYRMKNKPFAIQIIEASAKRDKYLGNA